MGECREDVPGRDTCRQEGVEEKEGDTDKRKSNRGKRRGRGQN